VNEILDQYFHTDWAAMTVSDWMGLVMTFITFFMMIALYWYVFNPAHKETMEAKRHIPTEDDFLNSGEPK
jgi:cytochrome c oxidase cbb3-type subunit 4